ncbi:Steryl-sulfatase [Dissostichus eleginoides]|uniref:Steryl-sulfatase n=1 Tax=Dissostichus eleginoides TaxID=100907 RepID=A0AAD9B569_DISEL|nr:Steryl-sulfatase [Dissostichus eleginoides]
MRSTWRPSPLPLLILLVSSCVSVQSSKTNFVLMMVDDLGIGDLGCYGNTTLRTPDFGRGGGEADSAHRGSEPLRSQQGGVSHRAIPDTIRPVQRHQNKGKWHLGLNCESSEDHCHHPSNHGFDFFFAAFLHYREVITVSRGLLGILLSLSAAVTCLTVGFIMMIPYLNCVLMRDHRVVEQPFTSENLTQRMTHEAVDSLERNSATPFLLFYSFIQVHTAMFASAAFRGTSRHGIYGDAVHEVDWSVGQIMQTLDRLNLRENTLVYLTSDQGAHLEISDGGEVHRGSNGIYKAGKEVDEPTSNMDLFPTVVKLSGASGPEDRTIDGHDLMDLLQGRVDRSNHEFLFHYCNAYLNAVRWHPQNSSSVWKAFYFTPNFYPDNGTACFNTLACFCTPGFVTYHDPPLLFDLSRDQSESTPLTPSTEHAFHSVLAAMEEAAEKHRGSVEPVESQMSALNLMWKPWLQPCCSTLSQLCQCQQDQ